MKYIITIFAILMVILNNFAKTDLVRYRKCNSGCGSVLNQTLIEAS